MIQFITLLVPSVVWRWWKTWLFRWFPTQ